MKFLIWTIFSLLIVSIIAVPEASAENPNLIISAENSQHDNIFAGPMVIEVKIVDKDISAIDKPWAEPNVTINGTALKMIQAIDGNWYGYFADKTMAETADATTSINGKGLDFGGICTVDNARDALFYSSDPNFFKGISFVATSDPSCGDAFDQTNINVLRNATQVNSNSNVSIGQINIVEANAWPFIQLFDFTKTETQIVTVTYNKINEKPQIVTLAFRTPISDIDVLKIEDTDIYIPDSNVHLTLSDLQLNIDPTDEDSWTWNTLAPGGLFYQVFDENGNLGLDRTSDAVDILEFSSELMFKEDKKLILDPFDENFPTVVNSQNNVIQKIIVPDEILGSHPITFRESGANTGTFRNFVDLNDSNLVVSSDATEGSAAWLTYTGIWHGILIFDGIGPDIDNDGFSEEDDDCNDLDAAINPEAKEIPDNEIDENCDGFDDKYDMFWERPEYLGNETATLTINNEFMNKNSNLADSINVKINSRYNPEGILLNVKETKIDSGEFVGNVTLFHLKNNKCLANMDNKVDKLCVFDEDKIYASFSYPNTDGVPTSSNAKSAVSSFRNIITDPPNGKLKVNFPGTSDDYFTAIDQIEEKLKANNITNYTIQTYKPIHTDKELFVSQTISIEMANRTQFDKIFQHNFTNYSQIDEINITESLKDELKECSENKNSINCDEKTNLLLDTIHNHKGIHNFTETIFHNVTHISKKDTNLFENYKSENTDIKYPHPDNPVVDWKKPLPILQFLNFDLVKEMIPNAMASSKNDNESYSQEFLFLNGFSYGFGFGKSFEYEYTPEGLDDFFSTEARFAFGFGIGLRIPIEMTVIPNPANSTNLTSDGQNISFTLETFNATENDYKNLGIEHIQIFEGHEFAAYLGPEIIASAGIFEDGPFYLFEKEIPKPRSTHFVPPLGEGRKEITTFYFSLSDVLPFLDFAKFFFSGDLSAGFNADMKADKIKMEMIETDVLSFANSTKKLINFTKNGVTQDVSYPEKSSLVTIGNLTYNSSLIFKPKIIGEAYFMGITILSKEIFLGEIPVENIVLQPHEGTPLTHDFLVNGTSDGFYKGVLDINDHQVHYLSSVGPISYDDFKKDPPTIKAEPNTEIAPYDQKTSVILSINATSDGGHLTITLPRKLIDAKVDDKDEEFTVLANNETLNFDEETTQTDRTLMISFPEGTTTIEISETHVVPEFGVFTTIILGATLTGIIALTLRSKLITRF